MGYGEACSATGCSNSKLIDHFIVMEFFEKMVSKAIQENGVEDIDSILETPHVLHSQKAFL